MIEAGRVQLLQGEVEVMDIPSQSRRDLAKGSLERRAALMGKRK